MEIKTKQKNLDNNNYLGRSKKKYERDIKLVGISYIGLILCLLFIIFTQ